jgi:hypothetical protein
MIELAPKIVDETKQKGEDLTASIRTVLATAPPAELGKRIAELFYTSQPNDKKEQS